MIGTVGAYACTGLTARPDVLHTVPVAGTPTALPPTEPRPTPGPPTPDRPADSGRQLPACVDPRPGTSLEQLTAIALDEDAWDVQAEPKASDATAAEQLEPYIAMNGPDDF